MATANSPTDRILPSFPLLDAAGLPENFSLDSQTNATAVSEPAKKLPTSQYGSSDLANIMAKPINRSTTPLHVDPNAFYFSSGYPSAACIYEGYDGQNNEWNNYSRYVNPNGVEMSHGVNSDHGNFVYHQNYGFTPLGHDGQLYGMQHYEYPSPFYQPPTSTSMLYSSDQANAPVPTSATAEKVSLSVGTTMGNPNNRVNSGNFNRSSGSKTFRPSNQNLASTMNGSYATSILPTGFPSSGYHDPRFGYGGFHSPVPWLDGSTFGNESSGYAMGATYSSPLSSHSTRPTSNLGQVSGFMNHPSNRMYSQYGNRGGASYGPSSYNNWAGGRGWWVVDNKYKTKGHGYGNENFDGLSEMNKGPRAKGYKHQMDIGPIPQTAEGQNLLLTESNKEENIPETLDKEQYNREDFPEDYSDAKFFVIKSYSEDDIHKSIKYNVWTSTANGNKKLDATYLDAKGTLGGCPLFLLFSVNTSGQFVGVAEMVGPVDFNKTVEYWQQEKWIGCFPVKWHIIKDLPNSFLRHITLENNENKPVTNSRDTQEVIFEKGIEILKIFKDYKSRTSILDDFGFYAARERLMQEKKAKQKTQKQVLDTKLISDVSNETDNAATVEKESLQKSTSMTSNNEQVDEAVKMMEEMKLTKENGSNAVIESSPKDAKP